MEAASAVDGLRAGRLGSLLTQLLPTQSTAEPRVRRLVLLIERRCKRERGGVTIEQLTSEMMKVKTCESVIELQTTPM